MPHKILTLPHLEIKTVKHSIGLIRHVLLNGGDKEVINESNIQISSRRKAKLVELSDNQKIVISKRKNVARPADVNGVLYVDKNKNLSWLSHELIEKFEDELRNKGQKEIRDGILQSWNGKFIFQSEERDTEGNIKSKGLRPPQIGGLHAIGAHWSLHNQPATIVMPTGTGKTETMIASLIAYRPGPILIVVPSKVLRDQTAEKFITLGLLRSLGNLNESIRNPIVGIIKRRPKLESDLDIFEKCNVIVSTMSAIGGGSAIDLGIAIAKRVETLIVDEAHHIGAAGWGAFRDCFPDNKVLQFTATPYRRDGKLVDGKVIYNFPLHVAQVEGYFKKIFFDPVYEIDHDTADEAIATAAIQHLRKDITNNKDHLLMARCSSIDRAYQVSKIYTDKAADLKPLVIHSEAGDTNDLLEQIKSRESRIIICVNMLGEGFDLPQLKIAAVHDTHKSLAVLLQFIGRFTRSLGDSVGDASVIANIADQDVSYALERLYSEDADWNKLLSEFSSEASKKHAELVEFLNSSERLDGDDISDDDSIEISHQLLRPTLSTLVYEARAFSPKEFFKGLAKNVIVQRVWLHKTSNTLFFVTYIEPSLKWTRSRELRDRQWDLFILHYNSDQNLIYLSSTDKSSLYDKLAKAVGATRILSGEVIFKTLGKINRLIFQNMGLRKHGRRNLRYALYTGVDVANALSISEQTSSVKSNLSGTGWEDGKPVTIGCSYKGRIWSRENGTIPEFVEWCRRQGEKLQDRTIDPSQIIQNVLIPEEVESLPDRMILGIDWPLEILRQSEDHIVLSKMDEELPISLFNIEVVNNDPTHNQLEFRIRSANEDTWCSLILKVGGEEGFSIIRNSQSLVKIKVGKIETSLEDYFSNYPPLIRYMDLSELDGNLLVKPQNLQDLVFPEERFEAWEWRGVDKRKESMWKNGELRKDSIQWKASQQYIEGGFDVVFDDDSPGEAADLICIKEEADYIRLALIHCKFTTSEDPGRRIKDITEVASQAVRSAKWKWKFKDLCRHIISREKN